MIPLFNITNHTIALRDFDHHLHGSIVSHFEKKFCSYVGAKYGCALNSATSAIFLSLIKTKGVISIPSVLPAVVANAVVNSGNEINFVDDPTWVGGSYTLHNFGDYKIIDSAQRVDKNQFKEANPGDLMIFSFYPTKPVGGIDGGIVVSDDKEKIEWFKEASMNGMSFSNNNWERQQSFPGWKMYMSSPQAFVALENLEKLECRG